MGLMYLLYTANDEQEGDHKRPQIHEQWATINPVSGVKAGGNEGDED